jgi:hypothetical protein
MPGLDVRVNAIFITKSSRAKLIIMPKDTVTCSGHEIFTNFLSASGISGWQADQEWHFFPKKIQMTQRAK